MSIASEITRLQGVKADILTAIADKGVTIPTGSALADCPTLIASITGGGGGGVPYLKNIMPTTGVKVVDENGYIGGDFLGVYYPSRNYYNNFAVVIPDADYSGEGLGAVTFVDTTATIGGRVYRTVTINGITWMSENLDYKFSGLSVPYNYSISEPGACYYNNDESLYGIDGTYKCGLLYNRYAVDFLENNKATLIPGWHVPTPSEWDDLFSYIGGRGNGNRLKAKDDSIVTGFPTNWNGLDDFGFAALPGGNFIGSFSKIGSTGAYWTYNSHSILFDSTTTTFGNYSPTIGCSLRLVKDS